MRKFFKRIWKIITFPFRWISKSIHTVDNFFTEEPEDTPLPEIVGKTVGDIDGLFYHINELRKRLFAAVAFMAITTTFSFIFAKQIIDYLSEPIGGIGALRAIDPTESIGVFMRVSLLSGFALALPFIFFQLWLFAAPGLSRKSRIWGLIGIPIVTLFFIGGLAFGRYVMMPPALKMLLNFLGIQTIPRPSTYINFVTSLLFWLGISFEFPFVIYILAGMGILKAKVLAKQWRIAAVIIAIVAAAITPTVDPVNMSIVMFPMIGLYFISVGLAYIAERGRK